MRIGIDPGISGAIAIIHDHGGVTFHDMPTVTKLNGKGNQVDAATLANVLREYAVADIAYLEQVGAMPGQGVTSMFSFGDSFGVIRGILAAVGIPYCLVRPQKWKKRAGLSGRDKDAARAVAMNLYPSASSGLSRKKDVGRADALLLAHYGD